MMNRIYLMQNPVLRAIAKYENHTSILKIKNYMKEKYLYFSFEFVDKPKISKGTNKLDRKTACQEQRSFFSFYAP